MSKGVSIVRLGTDPKWLGAFFAGPSWNAWWSILRAAYGLPLDAEQLATFQSLTGGRRPPAHRVRELWVAVGRGGAKTSIASLIACHASLIDLSDRLRPGEVNSVVFLAKDREQAKVGFSYTRAYFDEHPVLSQLVTRITKDTIELSCRSRIIVKTNDQGSVRGIGSCCVVLDEVAHWSGDGANSTPDVDVYRAVMPSLARFPKVAMLVGISTPQWQRGILFEKVRQHFGQDNDDILVIKAPTLALNPTTDAKVIEDAYRDDPAWASAEYGAEFRVDADSFISRAALEAVTVYDRRELPPEQKRSYVAFADAAGGAGGDSFALAIGYRDGEVGVLAALREWGPPFSPTGVVEECAELLARYGIIRLQCDRWGALFVVEAFAKHGIRAEQAARPKSDIYREFLAVVNSHRCELLDHPKMMQQFLSLERRVARGGKDSIDHPQIKSMHDDAANACAGCIVEAAAKPDAMAVFAGLKYPAGAFAGVPARVFN